MDRGLDRGAGITRSRHFVAGDTVDNINGMIHRFSMLFSRTPARMHRCGK